MDEIQSLDDIQVWYELTLENLNVFLALLAIAQL